MIDKDGCVVIIRMKSGEEIVAILSGKMGDNIRIEHPYYANVNPMTGNVTMIPYCPLSEETFFELDTSDIRFLVTASEDIGGKFTRMVLATNSDTEHTEEDPTYIPAQVVLGNNTKH